MLSLCIKFLQIISTDAMEEADVIDGSKQTGDRSNQRQRDGRGRNLSDQRMKELLWEGWVNNSWGKGEASMSFIEVGPESRGMKSCGCLERLIWLGFCIVSLID